MPLGTLGNRCNKIVFIVDKPAVSLEFTKKAEDSRLK
jgi:hypothetical protein